MASVPNPMYSRPHNITIINKRQLSSACQLPRLMPSLPEIARFMLVQGSVPKLTSTSHDRANPMTITARITEMSLLAKCFF